MLPPTYVQQGMKKVDIGHQAWLKMCFNDFLRPQNGSSVIVSRRLMVQNSLVFIDNETENQDKK